MTVRDLKRILEEFGNDDVVMVSRDSEGNRYSALYDYDFGWAEDQSYTSYVNEVSLDGMEPCDKSRPVLVLYPSH